MVLAAAQTYPARYDIDSNLINHYDLTALAARNGADLILFPELSLTGYEREKADELSFKPDDSRLKDLRNLSAEKDIIIVAGAPILIGKSLYIGSFIISPDYSISIYTKQFLHLGEESYFDRSFEYNPMITVRDQRFSIGICADIEEQAHAKSAWLNGTSIYLASIFYTPGSISKAHQILSSYARDYQMCVLMSNYCGSSYGLEAAGCTGFWDDSGLLISHLNDTCSGLMLVEKIEDRWVEKKETDQVKSDNGI